GSGRVALKPVCRLPTTDIYNEHPLHLGRPLWYQQLTTRRNGNYTDLVLYALYRLRKADDGKTTEFLITLLLCRFGGLCRKNHISSSNFVVNHLATYGLINGREIHSIVGYPSEPILAEASAYCTSNLIADGLKCTKLEVLEAVE